MNGGRKRKERKGKNKTGAERRSGRHLKNTQTLSASTKKERENTRLTSECSIPALAVGRRHENKDEEEREKVRGREGRGDSWMAALYVSEKEMFSKRLDESFRAGGGGQ